MHCLVTIVATICLPLGRVTRFVQLVNVFTHDADILKAVRQGECGGDHSEAQYCCVGCLVTVIGECDVAFHTSIDDSIRYDVRETEAHRAD